MSDAPVRLCPSCGEYEVERLISAGGGLVFKGPGFYATDYRQADSREGDSTGPKSSSSAKGEAKHDGGEAKGGTKESAGSGGQADRKDGGS